MLFGIDVRGPYVTPELNNELQCNVGNMWEKFTLYLYALKLRDVSTSKVYCCPFLLLLADAASYELLNGRCIQMTQTPS